MPESIDWDAVHVVVFPPSIPLPLVYRLAGPVYNCVQLAFVDPSIPHLRSTVTLLPITVVRATVDGPAVTVTGVGNPQLLETALEGHWMIKVWMSPFYIISVSEGFWHSTIPFATMMQPVAVRQ